MSPRTASSSTPRRVSDPPAVTAEDGDRAMGIECDILHVLRLLPYLESCPWYEGTTSTLGGAALSYHQLDA